MKIVIDQSIPGVDETFARHAQLLRVEGRNLVASQLLGAQALIVRSITRVDAALLEQTNIRFVGTTTIGTDHIDTKWLDQAGIKWASAPGCNADSAAQYTLAMLLLAQQRLGIDLLSRPAGIVGRGNVGSRLIRLLRLLGVNQIVACDPPLADRGEPDLFDMDTIARCGIISLHVPLTDSGSYATRQLINADFLDRLPPGCLLLNSSRGDVIDGRALADWLQAGRGFAALDVWPGEPRLNPDLVQHATIATPHVAGYSLDGKLRGTEMIYAAFCRWLDIAAEVADFHSRLGSLQVLSLCNALTPAQAILAACPVERDDGWTRALCSMETPAIPAAFDALRQRYPERRDFAGWVLGGDLTKNNVLLLRTLGFH